MTKISAEAREFRAQVENTDRFLETCEGGDPGSPNQPSIWFFGIEPGWSKAQEAAEQKPETDHHRLMATYNVEAQLKYQYNRKAFQLLAAIEHLSSAPQPSSADKIVRQYADFARAKRPFEQGSKGYFKANLFPEPFNNIGSWGEPAKATTGFDTKEEYRAWLRENRFKVLSHWIDKHRPKMLIGTSYGHLHDFMAITGTQIEPDPVQFEIRSHPKRIYVTKSGTIPLVVTPHLIGPSGLNSYDAIATAAEIVQQTLQL